MAYLTSAPIDQAALVERVSAPEHGAVATFLGVVRDHHEGRAVERLEYSAYAEMAERVAEEIVQEAMSRWPVSVALEHRLGKLAVGDVAVAVAAGAAHRDAAMEGCRYVIEEVKVRLPVWKKEFYRDGTVGWVDLTPVPPLHEMERGIVDTFGRPLGSLRISVTDRCNLRCRYCMPEDDYVWLPRSSILTFEEIARIAAIFTRLGAGKLRLTGGEPLLRHELPSLVKMLVRDQNAHDLAMTTNGLLLARHAEELRAAGLGRITVSLDTLKPERFQAFARSGHHADVIRGLDAAADVGFTGTKINSVIIRGFNEDEIIDLLEFGRQRETEVRFIEYMDVGGATGWSMDQVVSRDEILKTIAARYGKIEPVPGDRHAPADTWSLDDGTRFGIIASTTTPFCRDCDRSRITADGTWYLCLYADGGVDLREPLRDGADDEELEAIIRSTWAARTDRGAEDRAKLPERGTLYQLESLRADPRREMHTRGG